VSTEPDGGDGPIAAVVVTYESAGSLEACLASLAGAAPRRGVRTIVVDNASRDASVAIAGRHLPAADIVHLTANRGFAAGVNAGLATASEPWIAVVNPDVEVPAGGLDALADVLVAHPRAALASPRMTDARGGLERSVGPFPTPRREWAHSWLLDHAGVQGRFGRLPATCATVDWASGCAWLLRAGAVRDVGQLDEEYFMYFEDVDYCRRLHDAGWDVMHVPDVRWTHALGKGSSMTGTQPADGGLAALRYFRKFHPAVPEARVRAWLVRGWRLRLAWRRARALLGDPRSASIARRYAIAIEQVRAR